VRFEKKRKKKTLPVHGPELVCYFWKYLGLSVGDGNCGSGKKKEGMWIVHVNPYLSVVVVEGGGLHEDDYNPKGEAFSAPRAAPDSQD
jgi:hypothetical protein